MERRKKEEEEVIEQGKKQGHTSRAEQAHHVSRGEDEARGFARHSLHTHRYPYQGGAQNTEKTSTHKECVPYEFSIWEFLCIQKRRPKLILYSAITAVKSFIRHA